MAEKLVLWKPRPQRVAESFITPLVVVPTGPVLRVVLDDDYSPLFGFGAELLLLYVTVVACRFWAQSHGGEWVTAAERLQRLMDETATFPLWQAALIRIGIYVPLIVAMVFIVQPVSEFGHGFGGPVIAAGLILLLGIVTTIPVLTGHQRRIAASAVVERTEVPARQIVMESFRLLPRSYLSMLIAATAGFFAGLRFDPPLRGGAFVIVTLVVLQVVRQLPFFSKLPRRIHASFGIIGFWSCMLVGIASWGVPFSILFMGAVLLGEAGEPVPIIASIGFLIAAAILFGTFMGLWAYLINRVGQRRTTQSEA